MQIGNVSLQNLTLYHMSTALVGRQQTKKKKPEKVKYRELATGPYKNLPVIMVFRRKKNCMKDDT